LSDSNDWGEQQRDEESVLVHQGHGHGSQLYRVRDVQQQSDFVGVVNRRFFVNYEPVSALASIHES
jgi:hypothetical protein